MFNTAISNEDWRRSIVFRAHEAKNYKVMIDRGSCMNIIAKTTLEKKMSLKAEPHPHS